MAAKIRRNCGLFRWKRLVGTSSSLSAAFASGRARAPANSCAASASALQEQVRGRRHGPARL